MKKFLFGFVLLYCSSLFGQITILDENFDNPTLPAQWTIIDNDGFTVDTAVQEYTEAWIYKEDPLNSGNGTVSSTSYFSPVNRADRWLITPQLSMGTFGNFISWKGMSYDPSFPDSYKIMISTTGNAIADFSDTLTIVNDQTPYWAGYTESLEKYVNENIYIAFVNTTYNGFKLFLDSINVRKQDPLSLTKEEIYATVYPNPITNHLSISTGNLPIKKVQIHDALGQVVFNQSYPVAVSKVTLSTIDYQSGVYFLSISTSKGTVRKKVVK